MIITIEEAEKMRCPFGIAEFRLTNGCMAWMGQEVETDSRPMLGDDPGHGWRRCLRFDHDVWVKFEPGGYCQRLRNLEK